jgi:uncharacterized protein (DUF2147 family)
MLMMPVIRIPRDNPVSLNTHMHPRAHTSLARLAVGLAIGLVALGLPTGALAGDDPVFTADAILGFWETERQESGWSHIEIYEAGGKVHGRIVWLSNPVYDEDDPGGMAGQPVVDRNNPNESLRDRPLLGLELMRDFNHNGKNKWEDGRIYDPEDSKTYRCKLTLKDKNTLELFGYVKVGFVKLGRDTIWLRVTEDAASEEE